MNTTTRRDVLRLLFCAAVLGRPSAAGEFWNDKEPAQWSADEIRRLLTDSPWARPASAQSSVRKGDVMGFPGYGGTGRRGRHGGSGASVGQGVGFPSFSGVVRWQSAKPILEAVKKPLPASFHGHYVIVVANIPLIGAGHGRLEGDASSDEALDNLRNLTTVKPKDQEPAGPAIVQQDSDDASVLWFGFSKETITISPEPC